MCLIYFCRIPCPSTFLVPSTDPPFSSQIGPVYFNEFYRDSKSTDSYFTQFKIVCVFLHACMSVCATYVPAAPRNNSGTGVIGGREPPCRYWWRNAGPLKSIKWYLPLNLLLSLLLKFYPRGDINHWTTCPHTSRDRWRHGSTEVHFGEPMCFLGFLPEWRWGAIYRGVGAPLCKRPHLESIYPPGLKALLLQLHK